MCKVNLYFEKKEPVFEESSKSLRVCRKNFEALVKLISMTPGVEMFIS